MRLPSPLRVHGLDLSYFTGKLEGYLRGKGIPYHLIEMDTRDFKRCGAATGVLQMPQIEWHNGQWLSDTTLIIEFLEKNLTDTCILPDQAAMRFYAQLLEDFGDEWLWRPALVYRWANRTDAYLMSSRLADGMMRDLPLPFFMRRQGILNRQRLHFMWMDGYTPWTRARIEAHYLESLDALENILRESPFVLGQRPTLADYGFFGSMFRHFFCDPTPGWIMRARAPNVLEWVARLWNLNLADFNAMPMPTALPAQAEGLLQIVESEFIPYMQANEEALIAKRWRFAFTSRGTTLKIPVQTYRAWRYQRLRMRFQALDAATQADIAATCPALSEALLRPVLAPVPAVIETLPIDPRTTRKSRARTW